MHPKPSHALPTYTNMCEHMYFSMTASTLFPKQCLHCRGSGGFSLGAGGWWAGFSHGPRPREFIVFYSTW